MAVLSLFGALMATLPVEIEEHPPRLQGHHGKLRRGERSELLLVMKHGDFNGIYWDFMGIYGDLYGIL